MFYLIKELTKTDGPHAALLDKFDFYVVPYSNPDGVFKTQQREEDGGDRLWRKNLRDNGGDPNCNGVDLNRNWDFKWGGEGGGLSVLHLLEIFIANNYRTNSNIDATYDVTSINLIVFPHIISE